MLTNPIVRRVAAPALAGVLLFLVGIESAVAQAPSTLTAVEAASTSGPIRLRQPQSPASRDRRTNKDLLETDEQDLVTKRERRELRDFAPGAAEQPLQLPRAYRPGEFERYVQVRTNDRTIRRFGADLVVEAIRTDEVDVAVPRRYPATTCWHRAMRWCSRSGVRSRPICAWSLTATA